MPRLQWREVSSTGGVHVDVEFVGARPVRELELRAVEPPSAVEKGCVDGYGNRVGIAVAGDRCIRVDVTGIVELGGKKRRGRCGSRLKRDSGIIHQRIVGIIRRLRDDDVLVDDLICRHRRKEPAGSVIRDAFTGGLGHAKGFDGAGRIKGACGLADASVHVDSLSQRHFNLPAEFRQSANATNAGANSRAPMARRLPTPDVPFLDCSDGSGLVRRREREIVVWPGSRNAIRGARSIRSNGDAVCDRDHALKRQCGNAARLVARKGPVAPFALYLREGNRSGVAV